MLNAWRFRSSVRRKLGRSLVAECCGTHKDQPHVWSCHHERPLGREGSAVFPSRRSSPKQQQIPRFARNDNSTNETNSITADALAPRIKPSARVKNGQAPVAGEAAHPLVEPWCSAPLQTWLAVGPTADGGSRLGRAV